MFKIFDKIFKKRNSPLLMYHRIINNDENKGVHTIYYDLNRFEEQLKYLKKNNYTTITFKELFSLNSSEKKKGEIYNFNF